MIKEKLGKYRIIQWLGGGQFGDVYLVEDTILEKKFALKVSRMRLSDIEMLKEEARLLASLSHPNIVRFYNIDQIEGKFVMVLEYVEGSSLREIMMKGRIPYEKIVWYIRCILDALSYAHRKGIIHRDLKPENVLVSKDEVVKVTDFGLGKFIKKGSISASVAGTPIYMAPEAWKGKFLPQSDIFSVGCIFYEMLTQRPPFIGDSLEEIRKKIFKGNPTPPRVLFSSIPERIEKIIMDALKSNPSERIPSADEFLDRMEIKGIRIVLGKLKEKEKDTGFMLTPQQREIVESREKRVLVTGSAGTGKTTTLIYRAYHLIQNKKIPPDKLLILAFTRKAVEDIRRRLEELLGRNIRNAWIETFHSFGWKVLKKEGKIFDLPEEFRVIDPQNYPIALRKKYGANRTSFLLERVAILKSKLISADIFEKIAKTPHEKEIAEFYKEYTDFLKENELLDYDDLIYYPCMLLSKYFDKRKEWQEKFPEILVDELQDLNRTQYYLVKLLTGPFSGLFLTGDAGQSIYGWRGANPLFVKKAENEFAGMKKFILTTSFRLPKEIIQISLNLFRNSKKSQELPVVSYKKQKGRIEFYKARSVEDEASFVIENIKKIRREERKRYADFAVVYRVKSYSRVFEEKFYQAGIPYSIIGGGGFYEQEDVMKMIEFLEAIFYKKRERIPELSSWLLGLKKGKIFLKDGRFLIDPNIRGAKRAQNFLKLVEEIIGDSSVFSPSEIMEKLIKESGFSRKMKKDASIGANIKELIESSRKFKKNGTELFLHHVNLLQDLELAEWGRDSVKLMTVHNAKGLEFPVVFLVGMIENMFPLARTISSSEELDEERRLCYVAITRAEETLFITYPKKRFGYFTRPSRFLLDMLGM